jgi:two-component system, chemotaxis family, chemotaxis protein CheY
MALKVLIIDDSAAMRSVVKKTLRAAGFKMDQCLEAPDGAKALELLRENPVDLVLSDWHMPNMDGMELLKRLNQENLVPPCFILVTTEGRKERLREALALGARGYVVKPFQPEALSKILGLFLGEPEQEPTEEDLGGPDF